MELSQSDSGASEFLAERFQAIWEAGSAAPDVFRFLRAYPEATGRDRLAVVKVDQSYRWRLGLGLPVERYLRAFPELALETEWLAELVRSELSVRRARGESLDTRTFFADFPRLHGENGYGPAGAAGGLSQAVTRAMPVDADSPIDLFFAEIPVIAPTLDGHDTSCNVPGGDQGFQTIESPAVSALESVEGALGADRFVLHRRLGTGGMGIVYQAFDRIRGEVVAVKTMRRVDPVSLYRFKREFRSLADLSHPNLVTFHELVALEKVWLITMELIEGCDIISYVRGGQARVLESDPVGAASGPENRPGRPLISDELNRLREALGQLAEGVAALHDSGMLHRDIKPTNVLVSDSGRVVLLDFGLVAELGQLTAAQANEEPIVGTVAYMSPEQAAGTALSPASDWYSVGVILYEALTGTLPFHGSSLETLREKQWLEPRSPRTLAPGIPDDLDALCSAMLRRTPDERPSGREILERLRGSSTPLGPCGSAASGSSHEAPLIGRERHLDVLNSVFGKVKEGKPGVVLVSGHSGSGKTTLVNAFLTQASRSDEAVVLSGRCYERESVPFKALDSVVDALSRYLMGLSARRLRSILPADVGVLARMFPVLQRVEAIATAPRHAGEGADQQELRRRGLEALRKLLSRITAYRPLIVSIDDLHWADPDNAALLADLLRPPGRPALLLIGSHRSEGAEENPFLQALFRVLGEQGETLHRRDLNVGALSLTDARELALVLLGQDDAITRAQAHLIALESRGSPFFVNELVKHVQAGGGLNERAPSAEAIDLDEVLWSRVERLPRDARRLLELIAISARPIGQDVAFLASDLGAEGRSTLAFLRVSRLARGAGQPHHHEIEIYHDRIRESVRAHLPPEVLEAHHLRLARALEATNHRDAELMGDLFLGAKRPQRAADFYLVAAEQALELLAFHHAAKLYRLVLDNLPPDDPRVDDLPRKLGDALANAGRGSEAAQAYQEAAARTRGPDALELRHRAAMQLLISGRIDEGLTTLATVLGALGMALPCSPRRTLLSLALHRAWLRIRGLQFRERDVSQITPEDLTRIDVCWSAVTGLTTIDPIQGSDFQARGLLLALQAGEPYRIARALAMEGAHAASLGEAHRAQADRLLESAECLAERVGHPHAQGMVALSRAFAALMLGGWSEAREGFERVETLFRTRCTGVAWELDTIHQFSLFVLLMMGDLVELRRRWALLLKDARQRGDQHAVTTLNTFYSTMLRLADDQPESAQSELDRVRDRCATRGFHLLHSWVIRAQVHIDVYQGEGRRAYGRVISAWPLYSRAQLLRLQLIRIQLHELRGRSALAAACESPSQSAGPLRSAVRDARRLAREGCPWAAAHSLFLSAGVALARSQKQQGRELLVRAEEAFNRANMRLHAVVAKRRRGELLGGIEGVTLIVEADRWMNAQRIENPERMSDLLAPGYTLGLAKRKPRDREQPTSLH